jgi:hypothetical protein
LCALHICQCYPYTVNNNVMGAYLDLAFCLLATPKETFQLVM